MFERLGAHLLTWAEIHGAARSQPYQWNSFLMHDAAEKVRALVDPLPFGVPETREVEALDGPTHIVLTCGYHQRCAAELREQWGCELLVSENQAKEIECEFDGTFQEAELLWGFVDVVRVRNVRHREEVGFYLRSDRTLIVGDLLSGGRQDCRIPNGSVGFNAPEYLVDLQQARMSLQSLVQLDFDMMCFGHGTPVLTNARQVIGDFLESRTTWEDLNRRREKGFRLKPELRKLHST